MEIKNTTTVDERMFVKLQHFAMRLSKKYNFFNYLFWSCSALIALVHSIVSLILFYTSDKDFGFPYYSLFFFVILTGFYFIYYFILPKQMYKASTLYMGEERYIFRDNEILNETENAKFHATAEYKYDIIKKVYERTGVFYIYVSNNQVLLVSKYGFETSEGLEAVRQKLKASVPAKKYKIIK